MIFPRFFSDWRNLPQMAGGGARGVLAGAVAVAMSGCASLDTAAPPVATLAGGEAAASGSLAAGRALYVGRCAKCHAPEPIAHYQSTDWDEILPDMAARTKLNPREAAQLRAYIDAALAPRPGPQAQL